MKYIYKTTENLYYIFVVVKIMDTILCNIPQIKIKKMIKCNVWVSYFFFLKKKKKKINTIIKILNFGWLVINI